MGSRGSVIPLFNDLIKSGKTKLPITDKRMTRFFVTVDQGIDFVLSCMASMHGGEVFIPKIPSGLIMDIARAMLPNAEFDVIGIRPGEKLHEAMISEGDSFSTYDLGDRYVIETSLRQSNQYRYGEHGAKPVPEGFSYASNTNDEWLKNEELKMLVATSLEQES